MCTTTPSFLPHLLIQSLTGGLGKELWNVHVCNAHRCQEMASDSLELKLQIVVSGHVGTENLSWVFWKGNTCSEPPSHLPRPFPAHFRHHGYLYELFS